MLRWSLIVVAFAIAQPAFASGADFLKAGNEARAAGRANDAITAYTKAIKAADTSEEDRAEAYRRRGGAWGFLGENINGIADFTEALKLAPDMGAALTLRGYLRGVVGQYEAAEKDQRAALALAAKITYPEYKPWVLQHYADLQRRRGEFDAALKTCDEAAAAAGGLADIHLRRAWIYLDMGREADARAERDKFLGKETDTTFASYWPDERGAIDRLKQLTADAVNRSSAPVKPNSVASSDDVPGLAADGTVLPLRASQLDASEQKTFATLPPSGDDARKFLYTRGYLRYSKRVVAGSLAPLQLPPLPARENWNRKFLSDDEATGIVDVAIARKLAAKLPPQPVVAAIDPALFATHGLPAIAADGRAEPLTPGQLNADEKKTYASLPQGSAKAKQFLYVRGYLRFCRLVVAGTIAPLQLPSLPARENWNREHLSQSETHDVLDVALAMKISARLSAPPAN